MKKNIIIAILAITSIMAFISTKQMANEASYWMNRSEAAEDYIEALESDFPEYIDTTSGTDAYNEYYNYK